MKINEKYFVPFLIISALVTAVVIAVITVNNRGDRAQTFKKVMQQTDSLKYKYMPVFQQDDSLSIESFEGQYVIIDFWATWTAPFSQKAHKQLTILQKKYPTRVEILAAIVQDKPKRVEAYIQEHEYPFHYVLGTEVFNTFDVPGVPTQLVYSPDGKLISIFSGSADAARLDSLQAMIAP